MAAAGPRLGRLKLEISLRSASRPARRATQAVTASRRCGSGPHRGLQRSGGPRHLHWLRHKDGPSRVLEATPGVRARLPRPFGAGRIAYVADHDGVEALYLKQCADPGLRTRRKPGSRNAGQPAPPDPQRTARAPSGESGAGTPLPSPVSASALTRPGAVAAVPADARRRADRPRHPDQPTRSTRPTPPDLRKVAPAERQGPARRRPEWISPSRPGPAPSKPARTATGSPLAPRSVTSTSRTPARAHCPSSAASARAASKDSAGPRTRPGWAGPSRSLPSAPGAGCASRGLTTPAPQQEGSEPSSRSPTGASARVAVIHPRWQVPGVPLRPKL